MIRFDNTTCLMSNVLFMCMFWLWLSMCILLWVSWLHTVLYLYCHINVLKWGLADGATLRSGLKWRKEQLRNKPYRHCFCGFSQLNWATYKQMFHRCFWIIFIFLSFVTSFSISECCTFVLLFFLSPYLGNTTTLPLAS